MTKLNQVIAIEKGVKQRVYSEITQIDKAMQKEELFNGFVKTYRKRDADGEDLPPEKKHVQMRAGELLDRVATLETEGLNIAARKDWTNCIAKADVIVDGRILIPAAPVTFLLALEKRLTDLRTLVGHTPVLSEDEEWSTDAASGLSKTAVVETHRTKKLPKPIVLYPATAEHPAQTQLTAEDVIVGFWQSVRQSGAMTREKRKAIAMRIEKMHEAVKAAREAANSVDVVDAPNVGDAMFDYLFADAK